MDQVMQQSPTPAPEAGAWKGPLAGLRVLDLTRVLAGPLATQFLADLGAEVLKLEAPERGDETRGFAPFLEGESHYFLALNRGKRSMVVDLREPEGAEILRGLVAGADVLIENFRPGVMQRLGLGAEALMAINPRLIYCAISGFGLTGPLAGAPSFDIVTQAMTGVMSVNGAMGGPPVKLGLPIGDMSGGIFGALGILSALHERSVTGRGRLVDASLYDGTMSLLGYLSQLAFITGQDPQPMGSAHPSVVPYDSFPAADGSIVIACLADHFWPRLCAALDCPDLGADPGLATMAQRRERRGEIEPRIAAITRSRSVAEWRRILEAHDIPHAPVLGVREALAHPHAQAREMVVEVRHERLGPVQVLGRPIKFPGSAQVPLEAPPVLGQHTAEILRRELHYSDEKIRELGERGVIDRGAKR
ncbi:CaiB/BaiF CoA transferase family protein [Pseudoroseomonas ludipueritiae]|uniref:CoA transferase n=1 Tax=Pseudoroseomonas ludipueritiae TaxID=198093 RepID=A0ABR7R1H3_9PROT|nr:CoA transferase [Pseudoroseomonas ludipueritiae]MBC9175584.1 CoA transferase [Pseudoroseomonas ludipueritiae]MCG7359681.1 CoA transferase [Roseomonas sp. ACRSG]